MFLLAMKKVTLLCVGCLALVFGTTGCNFRRSIINYVPTRTAREFLGERTNVHPIVPITADLRQYKVIAIKHLDNLMLDAMPVRMYDYLNGQLVKEISRRKLFNEVVRIEDEAELGPKHETPPTLVLDGFVDNYNPGSRGLRLIEMGLNHAVVTIRFQLRDRQTDAVVGSASITVYERAARKTVKSAIERATKTAAEFIKQGTKTRS
jgi:hypothetical protein